MARSEARGAPGRAQRSVEETNRRMLRARDAMDRDYAQPLDIPTLARIAQVSEAHFIRTFRPRSARRRTATCSGAASSGRCSCCARPTGSVTDICFDVGFGSLGTFSRTFRDDRRRVADAYRRRGPTCHPGADLLHDGVDATEQFWRSAAGRAGSVTRMFNAITHSAIYVLDQDEALDFYVGKLGLEVNADVDLGFMRWLTVNVPGPAGPPDPAGAARPAGYVRGDGGAGPRPADQGRDWGLGSSSPPMTAARPTRAARQRRGVHPGADPAAVRHRLRPARPVRQPHPDQPAGITADSARERYRPPRGGRYRFFVAQFRQNCALARAGGRSFGETAPRVRSRSPSRAHSAYPARS